MAPRFEFWFDFSCPYAYLASTQVEALAERTGAELDVRPMLLGGVFRARQTPQKLFATMGPEKTRHNMTDMHRWATDFGVPLSVPTGHPFRTVEALRALLAVGPPYLPLAHRLFRAYWVDGEDISKQEVLQKVLRAAGHEPAPILERIQTVQIKDDLRRRTDEAIERGIFGAPAFFVGEDLYWGQDRMDMVEMALGKTPASRSPSPESIVHPVDVYFDYSSPFSYIGAALAEAQFGDRARWHPMLLGALFKAVGTANVPLFQQNEAKRRFNAADLERQAERAGVPWHWPSRFPMKTVLPLRVTLAAKAHETAEGRRLVHRMGRAYWGEDQDISQPEVVRDLADEVGLDGKGLVEATSTPEVKALLRDETEEARAAGVFGAPTYVVRPASKPPALFWGADRIGLAARAAAGEDRLL